MKKGNISTYLLALVGAVYFFVSLIFGIITGGDGDFWVGFGFFTFATVIAVVILLLFVCSFALCNLFQIQNTTFCYLYLNKNV